MKLRSLQPLVGRADLLVASRMPDTERNYGQGRGGRPWRRLRDEVMRRDGYQCQPCKGEGVLTMAIEVDHITPQAEGGKDELANLQAICGSCHKVKTAAEAARGVRRASEGGA